ncbi:MAG: hypothetical protein H7338_10465, partial [Candidatus Sericytochromatia bacterium]|nr:hypothetical protein [Candidatus Sericytochromatia bacterium]
MQPKKRRIMASVFTEPMAQAQLVSLRNTFGTAESLAEAMVESHITPNYDDALRRARMIFCSPGDSAVRAASLQKGAEAKADTEGREPAPEAEVRRPQA